MMSHALNSLNTILHVLKISHHKLLLTGKEGLATAFSESPSVSSGGEWRFINDSPYCSL